MSKSSKSHAERSIYTAQKTLLVCAAGRFSAARNLLCQEVNRSIHVDAAVDLLEQGMKQMKTIEAQLSTAMRTVVAQQATIKTLRSPVNSGRRHRHQ